jgi:tetratricopeptide (TPR) repeat protein
MRRERRQWQPGDLRCCSCDANLVVTRQADTVTAGAAILPGVPGAVCERCLPLVEGLAVQDLKAAAAATMLCEAPFEARTEPAVQFFLDLYGWQPDVVAGGAMRLHADGRPAAAYRLLDGAMAAAPAGFYQVERAALLLLDGETGKAHDQLLATGPDDHPCWHLHRGTLAYSVGRADAACEHWRLQTEARPDHVAGWQTLAYYLLFQAGDVAAAAELLERATALFPDHPELGQWLAEARERLADSPERGA